MPYVHLGIYCITFSKTLQQPLQFPPSARRRICSCQRTAASTVLWIQRIEYRVKRVTVGLNTVNILRMTTGFHTFVNTSSPPSVSPVHTLEMALQLLTTSLSCLINRRIFFPLSAVFEAHSLSSGSVCNEDMAVGMMTFMPTWRIES